MGIAASRTSVGHSDLEVVDGSINFLKGGFHYGQARKPVVYIPPKPLLNHGPHRCTSSLRVTCAYDLTRRKMREKLTEACRFLSGGGVE